MHHYNNEQSFLNLDTTRANAFPFDYDTDLEYVLV